MVAEDSVKTRRAGVVAGWVAGPLTWAVNTELGQILPHTACASGQATPVIVSFACAFVAVIAAIWSAYASRDFRKDSDASSDHTHRFLGLVGARGSALFAFALILQGASSVMLGACLR